MPAPSTKLLEAQRLAELAARAAKRSQERTDGARKGQKATAAPQLPPLADATADGDNRSAPA